MSSNLPYEEGGAGRPLVLVHGVELGASRDEWQPLAQRLAESGWRTLCCDLPGFGDALPEPRRYAADEQVAALTAFLEPLGPVVLAGRGHSAAYAVAVAAARPELVAGLVLLNPHGLQVPRVDEAVFSTLTDAGGRRRYEALADDDLIARWLNEDVYFGQSATPAEVAATAARARRPGAEWVAGSLLSGALALDARHAWLAVTQPSLLLWGEACADPPVGEAERWLLPLRPDAPFMMIAGEPVGVQKADVIYRSWPDTRARPHVERVAEVAEAIQRRFAFDEGA